MGYRDQGTGSFHPPDRLRQHHQSSEAVNERVRLIDAEWQQPEVPDASAKYTAEIKVYGNNRTGLLVDVVRVLTERKIDVASVNTRTSKQGTATISLSFDVQGKQELNQIIEKIRQVESVLDIERTTG